MISLQSLLCPAGRHVWFDHRWTVCYSPDKSRTCTHWAFPPVEDRSNWVEAVKVGKSGSYLISASTAVQLSTVEGRPQVSVEFMMELRHYKHGRVSDSEFRRQNHTSALHSISHGTVKTSLTVQGIFWLCKNDMVSFVVMPTEADSVISLDSIGTTSAHFLFLGESTASRMTCPGNCGEHTLFAEAMSCD